MRKIDELIGAGTTEPGSNGGDGAARGGVEERKEDRKFRELARELLDVAKDHGIRRTSDGTWYRKT
jgi:hypothetical protein